MSAANHDKPWNNKSQEKTNKTNIPSSRAKATKTSIKELMHNNPIKSKNLSQIDKNLIPSPQTNQIFQEIKATHYYPQEEISRVNNINIYTNNMNNIREVIK